MSEENKSNEAVLEALKADAARILKTLEEMTPKKAETEVKTEKPVENKTESPVQVTREVVKDKDTTVNVNVHMPGFDYANIKPKEAESVKTTETEPVVEEVTTQETAETVEETVAEAVKDSETETETEEVDDVIQDVVNKIKNIDDLTPEELEHFINTVAEKRSIGEILVNDLKSRKFK